MKTSEVLYTAADLIEERGWVKGAGWVTAGRQAAGNTTLCLEGGIMAALGMRAEVDANDQYLPLWTCPAYKAVADYLDRDVEIEDVGGEPRPKEALYWWNDAQDAAGPVIETLRAAAVIEAAKEQAEARESVTWMVVSIRTVNEYLTKSISVRPNDKKTDLLVLTIVEFATGGQHSDWRFVMDRHMWQRVVDGLAANGVVAASVGAVSA